MNFSDNLEASGDNVNVSRLLDLWRTEANAPEILRFEEELVSDIQDLLSTQQESIDRIVQNGNPHEHFTVTMYQMEIERIRYSLSRYLRTRLVKIEKNLEHILVNDDVRDRLSGHEEKFAYQLNQLNSSFYSQNVSARFDDAGLQKYYDENEDRKLNAAPKLQDFVFCRAVRDVHNVQLASGQYQAVIRANDTHILQYRTIQNEVLQGNLVLL